MLGAMPPPQARHFPAHVPCFKCGLILEISQTQYKKRKLGKNKVKCAPKDRDACRFRAAVKGQS